MLAWIRKMLIQLLEWIIGESLPEVKARVVARRQAEADRKAVLDAKVYRRTFTYSNGHVIKVEGNTETIRQYTDAWGEGQTPPDVRLVAVKEEVTF